MDNLGEKQGGFLTKFCWREYEYVKHNMISSKNSNIKIQSKILKIHRRIGDLLQ